MAAPSSDIFSQNTWLISSRPGSAMISRLPEHSSTTSVIHTHGRKRSPTSFRLWRRPAMPIRRRSTMAIDVMTMAIETICTVWIVGIIQNVSWMYWLNDVAASHLQNSRITISPRP